MRHALFPAVRLTPASVSYDQEIPRKSILASILEALHDSRRHQAQRIIRQYRHLLAHPDQDGAHASNPDIGGHDHAGK